MIGAGLKWIIMRKIDESGCYYRRGFKSCQDHVSEIPQKIRSPEEIRPFSKAPFRQAIPTVNMGRVEFSQRPKSKLRSMLSQYSTRAQKKC